MVDPDDARIKRVYLTDRGALIRNKSIEETDCFRLLSLLDKMDQKEIEVSTKTLNYLVQELLGPQLLEYVNVSSQKIACEKE